MKKFSFFNIVFAALALSVWGQTNLQDWAGVRKIIYSYAEDSNGNGKVDRIRVQTNLALYDDFSRFDVEVYNYSVRQNDPFRLVSRVVESPEAEDGFSFYIYLEEGPYLYDGQPIMWRVTRNDNSLVDLASRTLLIGDPAKGEIYRTINTIPPRVSYAVTLPGHNETYIEMSEPVYGNESNSTISGNRISVPQSHRSSSLGTVPAPPYLHVLEYFTIGGISRQFNLRNELIPSRGVIKYRLNLDSAPGVSNLANLREIGDVPSEWFVLNNLTDMGVRALDWSDPAVDPVYYMYFPAPRYPVDWNYSGYKTYYGNGHVQNGSPDAEAGTELNQNPESSEIFMPPNKVLTPEMVKRLELYAAGDKSVGTVKPSDFNTDTGRRRITDILVSRQPSSVNDSNYFAWPVWARYKDTSTFGYPNPGGDFWGQQDTDDGIIWEFDGTRYLQERDIILQARTHSSLSNTSLSLFFGFNVPAEWRNPQEVTNRRMGSGGLWLPRIILSPLASPRYNIVPSTLLFPGTTRGHFGFYPDFHQSPIPVRAGQLFTFDILKGDSNFHSGGKLDFVLRLDGISNADPNLFIARLDVPQGSNLGSIEWWTMIRPFSFDIQNVRLQSGGVTILNNVINSDNREVAYIRYHLVRPGRVTVQVYTLDGTLVKSLQRNEYRDAGEYTDAWDGTNNGGRAVARGMYYVRVVGPDIDEIREIMVIK